MGKFLFITTKGEWGGSEPLWCEAADKALREGGDVTVVLPQVAQLARPIEELATKGAKVVMRPPRARPTWPKRLEWKVKGIREPETQWWRSRFPEPFDVICVSQGGAYCVMNMPGLANWLMEIDTPFVLVGHSHRAYALLAGEWRGAIRSLFTKANKVCLVAQVHVGAVSRFLGIELRNSVVVQNPVNLAEAKAKTNLTKIERRGRCEMEQQKVGPKGEGVGTSESKNKEGKEEEAGPSLAGQPSTAFSNPFTSELGRDSENTSLTRCASGPAFLLDTTYSPLNRAPEALMACVARFEIRDKGQDLLLEALANPVWRERDFSLDFFGSGPDREILEDLISFYRLGDKVRIVGFESDIRKIWGEHGLLVLPSLSEGTPISLIEAQLCARASLVTRVDGNPEWVEEGKTGFLAEAPTVYHLRLALERAWEHRHRWAEMGEAAQASCLAKRDPDPAGTLLVLLRKAADR